MKEVRTRFAPSPTGYMHVGNLRTALYTYLIAKSCGGRFILRIEDTDQQRYVEGSVDVIYDTLRMVGINHDEGPDKGGEYGPYIQSERKDVYKKYADALVDKDGAYYCFCSKERLEGLREDCEEKGTGFKYDGYCRQLNRETARERIKLGEACTVRQKVPVSGTTSFVDQVFGTITVENSSLDDGILLKSDGMPTYNFANVIDDNLMKISHVVRGSEYLSSTPKYNLIYEAFGWEVPLYVHLPLLVKEGGRKLSKREDDASFQDLCRKGYLPEAVINYIALLGWSSGTDEEFFTLKELEKVFSIKGLNKSPAVFDMNKLKWMNGEYIRGKSPEEFHELARPYFEQALSKQSIDLAKLSGLLHKRVEVLDEILEHIDFIQVLPDYDINMYVHKRMKTDLDISLKSLKRACDVLAKLKDWNYEQIHDALLEQVKEMGIKNAQLLWPVRTALSGKMSTPGGGFELLELLGKEESLRRIGIGIDKLSYNK